MYIISETSLRCTNSSTLDAFALFQSFMLRRLFYMFMRTERIANYYLIYLFYH